MPMFAWLGFRGTLREATLLLTVVAAVATVLTAWQVGPVWGLEARYDLAPELASGFLQLFLVDCGLILLPLSVAVAQQRHSAAEVASGRETLERLVASATGTAIIALDEAGRVTLFNPGAERMLGVGSADVVGSGLDRFHPADELARLAEVAGTRPRFVDICRALVAGHEPRQLWRFVRADGEERTMLLSLAAVPDAEGRTAGYLATAEDVTERERAQEALVQALEHQATAVRRLEELDQTKTDFVSTVSHELRTPITNIVGYTEMLEDGAGGDAHRHPARLPGTGESQQRTAAAAHRGPADTLAHRVLGDGAPAGRVRPRRGRLRRLRHGAGQPDPAGPGGPGGGARRAGGDGGRPAPAGTTAGQPADQRGEVHPRRRHDHGAARAPRRTPSTSR